VDKGTGEIGEEGEIAIFKDSQKTRKETAYRHSRQEDGSFLFYYEFFNNGTLH
jgi:hypothetical protein